MLQIELKNKYNEKFFTTKEHKGLHKGLHKERKKIIIIIT